jgi:hypothetical protein
LRIAVCPASTPGRRLEPGGQVRLAGRLQAPERREDLHALRGRLERHVDVRRLRVADDRDPVARLERLEHVGDRVLDAVELALHRARAIDDHDERARLVDRLRIRRRRRHRYRQHHHRSEDAAHAAAYQLAASPRFISSCRGCHRR